MDKIQKVCVLDLRSTPSRPSGPGVGGGGGGGNKTEGINSDPQGAENMKKEPKVLYFGCFLNCQIAVQIIPIGS